MTDTTRTDQPDPDAIYEAVHGFVSGRVPGYPEFSARPGERFNGSHPAVVEHLRDGFFRLAPDDIIRRQQAEILARLAAADPPPATPAPAPVEAVRTGPGPTLIVTRAEVVRKRDELKAQGAPHGYKALAKALGVSVATVRRRLH